MSELAVLLKRLAETTNNGLGEALRALTFVGNGYGCYSNFDVRPDAVPWPNDYRRFFVELTEFNLSPNELATRVTQSHGYRYHIDDLTIDVFWVWDGDGTLCFRLKEGANVLAQITTHDCKHCDEWEEIPTSTWPTHNSEQVPIINPDRSSVWEHFEACDHHQ